MDGNNVYTSVVIELPNQENPEDPNTFKVDFNDMDMPKDYVIDQIFCGENITVYALFEIPELINKKSDKEILEISNPAITDDYRFLNRNSYKKALKKKSNGCKRNVTTKGSEENLSYSLSKGNQNKSFYCLKHLGENYQIPTREEDGSELKVLFSKDIISKPPKLSRLKTISKGVNTEIAQSPKLIEEVQRAMTVNFSKLSKNDGRCIETPSFVSARPSYEIIDMDMQESYSSFSSDTGIKKFNKKASPNFLFVPLFVMEEGFKSPFRNDDKNQPLPEAKTLEGKTPDTLVKISLGTNTDAIDFTPMTSENEEKRDINSCYSSQCESFKTERNILYEKHNQKELLNTKSQLKKKDKDTILNEIKKLQMKLNALIRSIECNGLSLSNNDSEDYADTERRTSEETAKKFEPLLYDLEQLQQSETRHDNVPIFSPFTYTTLKTGERLASKKRSQITEDGLNKRISVDLVKSISSSFISYQEGISTVQSGCDEENSKLKLKNVFSGFNINWNLIESWKCIGVSKSDTNNRCTFPVPKYNSVKKSVSFDQRDDKVEVFCIKKMKNSSFKLEGSLKGSMRIIQSGKVHLGDNLISAKHETENNVNRKLRQSKTELQTVEKGEALSLKNHTLNVCKSLNEEEGDAKLFYSKQNLISQKFVQNPAIHYCSANTVVLDELLNSEKNISSTRGKPKVYPKTEESGMRPSSDPEKPTAHNRTTRKTSMVDSNLKKEVKPVKKLSYKNKISEKKPEKKESFVHEIFKPKSVSGSRKSTVKGTAESKLHVDKLIKRASENDSKSDITNSQRVVKSNNDEKPGVKTDRLNLRPRSRKRDLRESTPDSMPAHIGETEKQLSKKKSMSEMQVEPSVRKDEGLEMKEIADRPRVCKDVKEMSQKNEQFRLEKSSWLSSNPSSVVVELFSKKPTSVEEFYTEIHQERKGDPSTKNEEDKNSASECQAKEHSGNQEKPIVKSVWALTKVLLYEDGTKKLEVLEASLTPPGYSLKSTENNSK